MANTTWSTAGVQQSPTEGIQQKIRFTSSDWFFSTSRDWISNLTRFISKLFLESQNRKQNRLVFRQL